MNLFLQKETCSFPPWGPKVISAEHLSQDALTRTLATSGHVRRDAGEAGPRDIASQSPLSRATGRRRGSGNIRGQRSAAAVLISVSFMASLIFLGLIVMIMSVYLRVWTPKLRHGKVLSEKQSATTKALITALTLLSLTLAVLLARYRKYSHNQVNDLWDIKAR